MAYYMHCLRAECVCPMHAHTETSTYHMRTGILHAYLTNSALKQFQKNCVAIFVQGVMCTKVCNESFFFRKKKKKRNKTLACDVIHLDRVRVFVGYLRLNIGKLHVD
jgi:hypothetical protein